MSRQMIDVSALPPTAFGRRNRVWWGVLLMTLIEGTMFALLIATYLYVRLHFDQWPPPGVAPPPLTLPTINLALILLSCIPMYLGDKASVKGDSFMALVWLWTAIVAAFVFLGIRWLEVPQLSYRWDSNIFGSIAWTALVLHTFHVLASAIESIVLAVLIMRRGIDSHLHEDMEVDSLYWYFIALSWIPLYAMIYLSSYV